jgi:phosphoglycolate phosphatase
MTTRIETVALDMAGTTVLDKGLVTGAFTRAWERKQGTERFDEAMRHVIDTMGMSKIEVFRGLVSEDEAQALNVAFEAAVAELVAEGVVAPIPGSEDAIRSLKAEGRRVVLTTGFSRETADLVLRTLGWEDIADLTITPAEAGRGRPAPDMPLAALVRTGGSSVAALAVVGDTESDVLSGRNAGAGVVAAVMTGGHVSREALEAAGPTRVLESVVELPALLAELGV